MFLHGCVQSKISSKMDVKNFKYTLSGAIMQAIISAGHGRIMGQKWSPIQAHMQPGGVNLIPNGAHMLHVLNEEEKKREREKKKNEAQGRYGKFHKIRILCPEHIQ